MIIWRGYGFVVFFVAVPIMLALATILTFLTGKTLQDATWEVLPGAVLGGILIYFVGRYLNHIRPTQKFTQARGLQHGFTYPGSEGEAVAMPLEEQPPLSEDEQQLLRGLRNRHTFFFIPIQWWSLVFPCVIVSIVIEQAHKFG